MERVVKRRNERKELSKNTAKMNIIEKSKNQQIVKLFNFLSNNNFFFLKHVLYSVTLCFG